MFFEGGFIHKDIVHFIEGFPGIGPENTFAQAIREMFLNFPQGW